jgi:hypothetical protein
MSPNKEGRFLHSTFSPPKHKIPISSLCSSAVIIAVDPGGTTGWAVWQVHPEALSDPEILILENIQYWEHGQIDCGSSRGNAGNSNAGSAVEILQQEAGQLLSGERIEQVDFGENSFAIQGSDVLGISTRGESAGASELLQLVEGWPGAAIVVEDFILRQYNQGRDLLSPVRVMEKFEFGLWVMGRDEQSFRQQPSMAKSTVTDERLKRWGYYRRDGGMNHARDADRHAITFLRRCSEGKAGKMLREKSWPHLYGVIHSKDGPIYGPYYIPDKKASRKSQD